jgi:O-antigen ligase
VAQRFPNLPSDLRIGIHGEFLRVLTENGLFGLGAYLAVWLVSWLRLRGVLRRAMRRRLINPVQMRVVPLLFFVPFALFLGTEAPGTRSFVALILISLLPELVRGLLMKRSGAIATPSPITDLSANSRGMFGAKLAGSRS